MYNSAVFMLLKLICAPIAYIYKAFVCCSAIAPACLLPEAPARFCICLRSAGRSVVGCPAAALSVLVRSLPYHRLLLQ